MVRVIFNVVYRVRIQLRSVGDQRFPERMSMMRAEPRIFDPAWLYRRMSVQKLSAAPASDPLTERAHGKLERLEFRGSIRSVLGRTGRIIGARGA